MKKGEALELGIAKDVNDYPPSAGFCYKAKEYMHGRFGEPRF